MEKFRPWIVIVIPLFILVFFFLINGLSAQETAGTVVLFPEETDAGHEDKDYVYVDLKGEIVKPGVYKVEQGTRLFQVILLAGGLSFAGCDETLNLSRRVIDGNVYRVPACEEETKSDILDDEKQDGTLISINTADEAVLVSLPNIGSATARAIIAYREENGGFTALEELMDVSGIGAATYNNVKDLITL